jgi:DNA mismatch endonuclease, patch repair protein
MKHIFYENSRDFSPVQRVAEGTRKSMRSNRGRDTKLELTLRRALWRAGCRGYRKNYPGLPGKPDVYFPAHGICVFVHGCFWHGCPHCTRNLSPKANAEYWRSKIETNRARDERVRAELEASGLQVLVLWECEIEADLKSAVRKVVEGLAPPRPGSTKK